MLQIQNIKQHSTSLTGSWHTLRAYAALQPIGSDRFNSRMEKVYPDIRPEWNKAQM